MSRRPSTRFHLLKFPQHSNHTTMGTELLTRVFGGHSRSKL
jgi:hypothetical protein